MTHVLFVCAVNWPLALGTSKKDARLFLEIGHCHLLPIMWHDMKQSAKHHHINEETNLCVPTVLVVKELLQGIWVPCMVYLAKLTSCLRCLCPECVKEV